MFLKKRLELLRYELVKIIYGVTGSSENFQEIMKQRFENIARNEGFTGEQFSLLENLVNSLVKRGASELLDDESSNAGEWQPLA